MSEFPKCKYHATMDAVVVADAKEEKALGPGWVDHPNDVEKAGPAKPAVPITEQSKKASS